MSGGPRWSWTTCRSPSAKSRFSRTSLQVRAGEALCILGRSGTGKSVTLKPIISLLKPEHGQIWIEEEEITACTPRTCLACDERWDFSSRVPRSSIP